MTRVIAFALALAAASTAVPGVVAAQQAVGYRLGVSDQIEVLVYGQQDMSVKTRIKADGTVTLPLIGTVMAANETTLSLADTIERKLKAGGFINNPIVNVEISLYASKIITVVGEFAQPGVFALDRDHQQTLGEMVARVGGLRAGSSEVITVRHENGGRPQSYSLRDIALDAGRDVQLQAGDVIYAAPADQYYIYGQVGNAGSYPIRPGMSIRQGLARAGGPTLAGSEKKITLFRDNKEIDANLDDLIRPNDIMLVRERVF